MTHGIFAASLGSPFLQAILLEEERQESEGWAGATEIDLCHSSTQMVTTCWSDALTG